MSVTNSDNVYKTIAFTAGELEAVRAALVVHVDQCEENYCFRCTKENGDKLAAAKIALAKVNS